MANFVMRQVVSRSARTFGCDAVGSVVIMTALMLPIVLMVAGGAIDAYLVMSQRQRLQDAVDMSALAAARELGLSDARRENVPAVVEAMVLAMMSGNRRGATSPRLTTTVGSEPLEVAVEARQQAVTHFSGLFGLGARDINVATVARIVGRPNVCLLGLDPYEAGTISLEKDARVTGQDCAVYSNSKSHNGLKSKNNAVLSASLICTAGGKDNGPGNFSPEALTDCPTFEDPLAVRPEPQAGTCNSTTPTTITASKRLSPGTYCGGLLIEGGASVELEPGIYVIKDGELRVGNGARLTGANVAFYFTGSKAQLLFDVQSSIDLTAPRDGLMAGLLMFEARNQPKTGLHKILSDDARNLLGTIYLSRGTLHVDANSPIADRSAYTAVVARTVRLYGGPHLVLNSNYDQTDVPVPVGIRGTAMPVSLVR